MSNLLKDASILLTPTAYDDGSMNAIKPESGNGDEEVTNGDFATNLNNWETSSWWVWSALGAYHPPTNSHKPLYQETCVIGKRYLITFDLNVVQGAAKVSLGNNTGGTTQVFATNLGTGSYKYYVTASDEYLIFNRSITSSNNEYYLKNVSVVEDLSGDFDFERNSAATRVNAQGLVENIQILSPELVSNGNFSEIGTEEVLNGNFSQEGSEQISNGDFATDSYWTKGTGFSINSGSANCDGTQTSNTFLKQQGGILGSTINFVVGKTYKVNFDIIVTSGHIANIEVASGYDSGNVTTSGNHTTYITAVSTNNRFTITANPDFVGSIDNVSVKEVGQDWTLEDVWTIGDDVANGNGANGSAEELLQFSAVTVGKTYKFSYEVSNYVSGAVQLSGSSLGYVSANGVYTDYYTPASSTLKFRPVNFNGSITNISVKEVGQDWTFGTGWSIDQANSKAVSDTTASNLTSSTTLISGRKYKFTISASKLSSGTFAFLLRFNTTNTNIGVVDADGDFTFITTADSTSFRLQNLSGGTTDFSVTNISVVEITDDTNLPRINYEGFSYQDSLGSELVVNGGFDSDTAWSKGGGWSIANGTATHTGGASYLSQSILEPNKQYKVKIKVIQASGSNFVQIYLGNSPASVLIQNVGEYEYIFTSQSSVTLGFALRSLGDVTIDNVSVKEVTTATNTPRIDYSTGAEAFLLEPQSTNLVTQSESLSTIDFQSTVTDNNLASPTGDVNASLVVENTATNFHGIKKSNIIPTNANAVDYTISVFAKKKERQFLQFQLYSDSTQYNSSTFNLNDGTTTGNSSTHKIEDYGNGWYRCSFTDSVTQSTGGFNFAAAYMSQSSTSYYAGDGASGIYMFGFQLEQQSYATSYIPTDGAAATRNQELCNNATPVINSEEGTLYAEIAALADDGSVRMLSISDGSTSNSVSIEYSVLNNLIRIRLISGGVEQSFYQSTSYDFLQYHKIAMSYRLNDFKLYIDGALVYTDASLNTPIGLSELNFSNGTGGSKFIGNTKDLKYYPKALADVQLEDLTTI